MLVLLKMVDLLVLAVGSTDSLLAIPDAILEEHATAVSLHIRIVAHNRCLVHVLKVMRASETRRLPKNSLTDVLILARNALVCYVGSRLSRLSNSEL